jgi:hypothetical protein
MIFGLSPTMVATSTAKLLVHELSYQYEGAGNDHQSGR